MSRNDFFSACEPASLEDVLNARERRAALQQEFLERYRCPLICFTMNIPGEYKKYTLQEKAFDEGNSQIVRLLERGGVPVLYRSEIRENTGCESFYAVDCEAAGIKKRLMEIEEKHPIGRLFDIDVFSADGICLRGTDLGRSRRGCLICGGPVWECSRSRVHSAEEVSAKTAELIRDYFDDKVASKIACLAQKALLYEVTVTPKPGLVDKANTGAHNDMDTFTFIDSSCALGPFFRQCALKGMGFDGEPEDLLKELRFYGLLAEDEMLRATSGVNTHKGAIFSLGLLAAGAGYLYGGGITLSAENLCDICGRIAAEVPAELSSKNFSGGRDLKTPASGSHGADAYKKYGFTGIRGEAASGFPNAMRYGLPVIESLLKKGTGLNDACVVALLHLIAHVEDTNVVYRSSREALAELQKRISDKLACVTDTEKLVSFANELDTELIRRNISPGGCADLLSVSLMLLFCKNEFPGNQGVKHGECK